MQHLGFVERQPALLFASPGPAVKGRTQICQVVGGAEQVAVVRHVEKRPKAQAPGVAAAVPGEYRMPSVAGQGDLSITAAAENGQRAGVGIEQQHLLGRQREPRRWHVSSTQEQEGEARFLNALPAGHRGDGKAHQ